MDREEDYKQFDYYKFTVIPCPRLLCHAYRFLYLVLDYYVMLTSFFTLF